VLIFMNKRYGRTRACASPGSRTTRPDAWSRFRGDQQPNELRFIRIAGVPPISPAASLA
jgi:hypothetical protein